MGYVVVVDDDKLAIRLWKQVIAAEGLSLAIARDAEDTVILCRRYLPKVVIMDTWLRGQSMLGTASGLHSAVVPAPALILVTDRVLPEAAVEILRFEGSGYAVKPLHLKSCRQQLARALSWLATIGDTLVSTGASAGERLNRKEATRPLICGRTDVNAHAAQIAAKLCQKSGSFIDFIQDAGRLRSELSGQRHAPELTISTVSIKAAGGSSATSEMEVLTSLLMSSARLTDREVAVAMNCDDVGLHAIARRLLGCSLRSCRQAVSMRDAAHLVGATDEQIKQISFACGYRHASQFVREFKDFFGCRPSSFRSFIRARE